MATMHTWATYIHTGCVQTQWGYRPTSQKQSVWTSVHQQSVRTAAWAAFYILQPEFGCGWPISRLCLHFHIWQYTGTYPGNCINHNRDFPTRVQGLLSSLLWCCWLGGRKSIQPVTSGRVLVWLSVWGEVQICIWSSWCYCHWLSLAPKIQTGFTFLVSARPCSPDKGPSNGWNSPRPVESSWTPLGGACLKRGLDAECSYGGSSQYAKPE